MEVTGSSPVGSTIKMGISLYTIFGILGLITISIAIWLKNERRQDFWFIVGGALLLVYSVGIGSIIFIILQVVFITSAFLELLRLKKQG